MADVNKGFPAILKKIKLTFIRVELRLEGPVSCIEIAERFNGRLLEKEKRPSMHEKDIVATAQVIFKNENDLSEFIREVKKRQS